MINANRITIIQTVSAATLISAASALAQTQPPSSPLQPGDFLVSGASAPVVKDAPQPDVEAAQMPEPAWDSDKPFDPEARVTQFPAPTFAREALAAFRPAARAALSLHDGDVQEVRSVHTPADVAVSLRIDDQDRIVRLQPHSMREPDAQLLVQIEGGLLVPHEWPAPATYRGFVEGMPDVDVAASVLDGRVSMLILPRDPTKPTWHAQPLSDALPGVPAELHAVYRNVDVMETEGTCGSLDHDVEVINPRPANPDRPPLALRLREQAPAHVPARDPVLKPDAGAGEGAGDEGGIAGGDGDDGSIAVANVRCQIAYDADVEFYQANGSSVLETIYDMELIMNQVGLIYQNQVAISYTETGIIVRTAEPDPYGATNAGTLLCQFQDFWNSDVLFITRDVAHLFTGKDLEGTTVGIAWIGAVCTNAGNCNGGSVAYGLVQSRFSTNLTARVQDSAHELGHNWNACHCNTGGNCGGGTSNPATCGIMTSGISGSTTFDAAAVTAITAYRDSRTCLDLWQNPTHVNWAYNGVETGSISQPWNTIFEGLDACLVGGELHVQAGNYFQNPNVFLAKNIRAFNGTVRIGSN